VDLDTLRQRLSYLLVIPRQEQDLVPSRREERCPSKGMDAVNVSQEGQPKGASGVHRRGW